jgi:hypothetical protein
MLAQLEIPVAQFWRSLPNCASFDKKMRNSWLFLRPAANVQLAVRVRTPNYTPNYTHS